MPGIALEIRGQCFSCGQPLPINALVPQIPCARCQRPTQVDPDTWTSLLEDAIKEGRGMQPGQGSSMSMMTGSGNYQIQYGCQDPCCPHCRARLDIAAVYAQAQPGWVMCAGCGKWVSARPMPYGLDPKVFNRVQFIIGEDQNQFSATGQSGQSLQVGGGQPVALQCPSCGGHLRVDGSSRNIACQYCRGNVYIPDDLWNRLHPTQLVQRWFLWYDDRPRQGCQMIDIRASFPASDSGTAEIEEWYVEEGQTVQPGQRLLKMELIVNDNYRYIQVDSPVYGMVVGRFKDEMDDVPQGELLCRIEAPMPR